MLVEVVEVAIRLAALQELAAWAAEALDLFLEQVQPEVLIPEVVAVADIIIQMAAPAALALSLLDIQIYTIRQPQQPEQHIQHQLVIEYILGLQADQ
jgi:hypothetical protein